MIKWTPKLILKAILFGGGLVLIDFVNAYGVYGTIKWVYLLLGNLAIAYLLNYRIKFFEDLFQDEEKEANKKQGVRNDGK